MLSTLDLSSLLISSKDVGVVSPDKFAEVLTNGFLIPLINFTQIGSVVTRIPTEPSSARTDGASPFAALENHQREE
jgi:hypothetical protein